MEETNTRRRSFLRKKNRFAGQSSYSTLEESDSEEEVSGSLSRIFNASISSIHSRDSWNGRSFSDSARSLDSKKESRVLLQKKQDSRRRMGVVVVRSQSSQPKSPPSAKRHMPRRLSEKACPQYPLVRQSSLRYLAKLRVNEKEGKQGNTSSQSSLDTSGSLRDFLSEYNDIVD